MTRRLALVGEKPLPAASPDDAPDDTRGHFAVTDSSVSFSCHVAKLGFDRQGNLQAILTVDPDSDVSNRDISALRGRMLIATLEPKRRVGGGQVESMDPTVDPVTASIHRDRADRLIARWTAGEWDDADVERDAADGDDA